MATRFHRLQRWQPASLATGQLSAVCLRYKPIGFSSANNRSSSSNGGSSLLCRETGQTHLLTDWLRWLRLAQTSSPRCTHDDDDDGATIPRVYSVPLAPTLGATGRHVLSFHLCFCCCCWCFKLNDNRLTAAPAFLAETAECHSVDIYYTHHHLSSSEEAGRCHRRRLHEDTFSSQNNP